jgi:hypothetical protein
MHLPVLWYPQMCCVGVKEIEVTVLGTVILASYVKEFFKLEIIQLHVWLGGGGGL